jgi:hypothetical protein
MTILLIIKKYKFPILIVTSIILVENIAWLAEPTIFGRLLDAMIDHFYQKENVGYIFPLVLWIFIYLLNTLGGAMSRLSSGKVYSKMYASVASDVIIVSQSKGYPVSKTLARAELAKEYINFLKDRIPEIVWQISASFGAMFAIFFYDWRIAIVCSLIVLPIIYINRIYKKNVVIQQKFLHDNKEDMYKLLDEKNSTTIQQYFFSMVVPQTKIAKWNSIDYGIIKFLLMIIFVVVLFICVDVDQFTTGKIYSIVAYLWTFIASTEYLPGLMESIASVNELNTRLAEEDQMEISL